MLPLLAAGLISGAASLGSSAIGGAFGMGKSSLDNKTKKEIAQLQADTQMSIAAANRANQLKLQTFGQEFQEHMASTNFQRQAADMEAAGLNRSLAATTGAAAALSSTSNTDKTASILQTLDQYLKRERNPRVSMIRTH